MQARPFPIMQKDIAEHGPTPNCLGCRAASKSRAKHSLACRARFEEIIEGTEEGRERVRRAHDRWVHAVVAQSEEMESKKRRVAESSKAAEMVAPPQEAQHPSLDEEMPAEIDMPDTGGSTGSGEFDRKVGTHGLKRAAAEDEPEERAHNFRSPQRDGRRYPRGHRHGLCGGWRQ